MNDFTHFNDQGRARMVDVGEKTESVRVAVARGEVHMGEETLRRVLAGKITKGDVLAVAQVAGIMAAKDTSRLIPMCHPLLLTSVDIKFNIDTEESLIHIEAAVGTTAKTGVEMEALTAVSVSALTIYDMCKAADKEMTIGNIYLARKSGGRSGDYRRPRDKG